MPMLKGLILWNIPENQSLCHPLWYSCLQQPFCLWLAGGTSELASPPWLSAVILCSHRLQRAQTQSAVSHASLFLLATRVDNPYESFVPVLSFTVIAISYINNQANQGECLLNHIFTILSAKGLNYNSDVCSTVLLLYGQLNFCGCLHILETIIVNLELYVPIYIRY